MAEQMLKTTPSVLLTGIEHLIDLIEAEVKLLEQQPERMPTAKRGDIRPADAPTLEELDLLQIRLREVIESLRHYPRLVPLVDDYIGKRVQAMEKRQSRQNLSQAVVTTVFGALLGWAVSLLGTPASVIHLFFP